MKFKGYYVTLGIGAAVMGYAVYANPEIWHFKWKRHQVFGHMIYETLSQEVPHYPMSDYFPISAGRRWEYEITLPTPGLDPLIRHLIEVHHANGQAETRDQRAMIHRVREPADGIHRLILEAAEPVTKQGPFAYSGGNRMVVEKDDLNIYGFARSVYWAVHDSAPSQALEIITYRPEDVGLAVESGMDIAEPASQRLALFAEKPGSAIGFGTAGTEMGDLLIYVGEERVDGVEALHFHRIVKAAATAAGVQIGAAGGKLNADFADDLWFGKGVGLMLLIQRIDDRVSMIWNLKRPDRPSY